MAAFAVVVQAAAPGAGVRARLVPAPVLRGEFEQEKRLQGFRNPLVSKGDFLVARERGVLWNTRSPFASTLVLTRQRLLSRQGDGPARSLAGAQASPVIATANALLMALLAGDIDALSAQFEMRETLATDGSWSLLLLPKAGPLRKIFKQIQLQGDRHVRSVQLDEVRGDRTVIRFLKLSDVPATLSAAESGQFD